MLDSNTPTTAQPAALADAAASLLLAIFGHFDEHIMMLQGKPTRDGRKYSTVEAPLTKDVLLRHLRGEFTVGGRLALSTLLSPSGKLTRALAWDTDAKDGWEKWIALVNAASRLRDFGLLPLMARNPAKRGSGHMWLFADRFVDAEQAQLAAEHLAPTLKDIRERYPKPPNKDGKPDATGGRIRFPAGCYCTEEGEHVPVLVSLVRQVSDNAWHKGTEPDAWTDILGAVSDARVLECTFVPKEERPAPPAPERWNPTLRAPRSPGGAPGIKAWCERNPIDTWVHIDRNSKFRAPWRHEEVPSVHFYASEGRFYDYGDSDTTATPSTCG